MLLVVVNVVFSVIRYFTNSSGRKGSSDDEDW